MIPDGIWSQDRMSRPTLRTEAHSPLRRAGAALAAVVAATHVLITPEHVAEAAYLAVAFSVLSAAMVGVGVGLLRQDYLWLWVLGGSSCLAAIILYVISRSVGLPLAEDDIGRWADPAGVVALGAEGFFVVLSSMVLVRGRQHPLS
jgi:hypothetical protein